MFQILIAATLVVAIADWAAVAADNRRAERILKPATMVVLIGAALAMSQSDPAIARWFVLAALGASLVGDVLLMSEDDFVAGLSAFLVAHLLYIVAFATMGVTAVPFVLGAALVSVLMRVVGRKVLMAATQSDRKLGVPVAAYMVVISLMVVFAFGTGRWWAIVGALLFYFSDACIGWSRFVGGFRFHRVAIMTTYHLGQIGLVLSLLGVA